MGMGYEVTTYELKELRALWYAIGGRWSRNSSLILVH